MIYVEGFVLAVPTTNKAAYREQARMVDQLFIDNGALRVVECWGDDVPRGKTTDFYGAVEAKDDETVVFSWAEWPDKATRTANMAKVEDAMKNDPRFSDENNPVTFDGKRMIYGGFEAIVDQGAASNDAYIQGFVIPVYEGQRENYRAMAQDAWEMFAGYGALRVVEAFEDDVAAGQRTDFYRAVKAAPGESIVFSFMEWPSREACDEAAAKMQSDESMKMPEVMPFDPQRMIYAGFRPILTLGEPA